MANRVSASGTVAQLTPKMAMITPDRQSTGLTPLIMIDAETQFGSLSLESFLELGMQIRGELDTSNGRFFPELDNWTETRFLAEYGEGTVILGFVAASTRQVAEVWLHPTFSVEMKREEVSANPKDVVDHLWHPGDIVPVRLVRDSRGNLRLNATDIDDDEPIATGPAIHADGEPWLTVSQMDIIDSARENWEREQRESDAFTTALGVLAKRMSLDAAELESKLGSLGTETGEIPVVSSAETVSARDKSLSEFSAKHIQRMIANYRVELGKLVEQNQKLSEALAAKSRRESELIDQIELLRGQLSKARQDLQDLNKADHSGVTVESIGDRRAHFATTEEWILEEMRRFWIDTYTPADRGKFRLDTDTFTVSPSFCETFELLDDGEKSKAIRIAVHVVTGRNADENIAEVHDLRAGDSASAPSVVRDDGAVCRRVYVESHTAQARRMHFWKRRDGHIELSRVAHHDDFTP